MRKTIGGARIAIDDRTVSDGTDASVLDITVRLRLTATEFRKLTADQMRKILEGVALLYEAARKDAAS